MVLKCREFFVLFCFVFAFFFPPWHSGVFVLMDLKEKIVKSMSMTVKTMTVKIILPVLMESITTRAFAHLSTQVGRIENALPSICVSESIILLHMFSKPLYYLKTDRCFGHYV